MPKITRTIEIDISKYRYLTQDPDGEVYAHKRKPELNVSCGGWYIGCFDCDYIITGEPNKDYINSLVDLHKPFTFIHGILKQMEKQDET